MCDKRNNFCYICGLFVDMKHKFNLKDRKTVIEAFEMLFKKKYVESSWYEPEVACMLCCTKLSYWKAGTLQADRMPFSTPMVWHRQLIHKTEDCYFCQTNYKGHQYKTRDRINYAEVTTVTKPHWGGRLEEIDTCETDVNQADGGATSVASDDPPDDAEPFVPNASQSSERHFISMADWNDLVRDYNLSTRQSEGMASRLKQWNLVQPDFKITSKRSLKLPYEDIFKTDDDHNKLVYCSDVNELFKNFNHEYRPEDWRLFIDGSCKSKFLNDHLSIKMKTCF